MGAESGPENDLLGEDEGVADELGAAGAAGEGVGGGVFLLGLLALHQLPIIE